LHALKNTIERYIILTGQGRVFINNEAPEEVLPMDSVTIPANVAQKIENTGEAELVFLCICTPRFKQQNYYTLEDE
jgi:mannose-6-phosphate isomerase-like protein (cupin superfamily)